MAVEIFDLQSGRRDVLQNSSSANTQDPVTVTVAIQDLPPNSVVQLVRFLKTLPPDGRYGVTGYLLPFQDMFEIKPDQVITIGQPSELVRVYHNDMRRYGPNGLAVRAQRHIVLNNFQPTPEEDAIIQPL